MPEASLLKSAYDLDRCGIGIERAIVQAMIGERKFNEHLQLEHDQGARSGFILELYAMNKRGELDFGSKGVELVYLKQQQAIIGRIMFRSVILQRPVDNPEDFSFEEYTGFMKILFGEKFDPGSAQKLYDDRYKVDLVVKLLSSGIPAERLDAFFSASQEQLRSPRLAQRMLKLHTDKLELMVEFFEADVQQSGASRDMRPYDMSSEYACRWKRILGEELPTTGQLVDNAKKTVLNARNYIIEQKLTSLGVGKDFRNAYAEIFRKVSGVEDLTNEFIARQFSCDVQQFLGPLFEKLYVSNESIRKEVQNCLGNLGIPDNIMKEYFTDFSAQADYVLALKYGDQIPSDVRMNFKKVANNFMLRQLKAHLGFD